MMEELEKTVGDQVVSSQNRATCLQGQIDLIRSHQVVQDRRINYAVAQDAEESDGRINERFVSADSLFSVFSLRSILFPVAGPCLRLKKTPGIEYVQGLSLLSLSFFLRMFGLFCL